jgi:hypothetical protein
MHSYSLGRYGLTANDALDIVCDNRDLRGVRSLVRYSVNGQERELSLIGLPSFFTDGHTQTLELSSADSILRGTLRIKADPTDASLTFLVQVELVDPAATVRISEFIIASVNARSTFLGEHFPEQVLFRGEAPDAWTNAGNKRIDSPAEPLEYASDTSYVSGGYFHRQTGLGIFAWHVLPHQWIDYVKNERGTLIAGQIVDVPISGRQVLTSDPVLINIAEPINAALASMAAHQKPRRRAEDAASHFGWNNFDYYKEQFDRQTIRDNMAAIKKHPWMAEKIRYIVIDGFWETLVGDWDANRDMFPDGMEGMAREIAAEGFVPGIWISPLLADRNCKFLKGHPEYCVQYDGEPYSWFKLIGCDPPWGDRVYMDPTHPAVRDYVYRHMRRLHDWGYRYFKTDFLVDAIRPLLSVVERGYDKIDPAKMKFHDPDLGLARAHRAIMTTIRAAIGEESFWLGCGTFIPSGAELMDASRICADIGICWGQIRRNSQSAIFSSQLHGNAFLIDPDFAVFRGPDTMDVKQLDMPVEGKKPYSEPDDSSGPPMSGSQAEIWASATILCGGLVCLGDKISALNERGLAIVRTVLEQGGGNAATAVDFDQHLPRLWLKRDRGRYTLGVFNWDRQHARQFSLDRSADLPLPIGGTISDLWSGQTITATGKLNVEVAPTSVKLYQWIA